MMGREGEEKTFPFVHLFLLITPRLLCNRSHYPVALFRAGLASFSTLEKQLEEAA